MRSISTNEFSFHVLLLAFPLRISHAMSGKGAFSTLFNGLSVHVSEAGCWWQRQEGEHPLTLGKMDGTDNSPLHHPRVQDCLGEITSLQMPIEISQPPQCFKIKKKLRAGGSLS